MALLFPKDMKKERPLVRVLPLMPFDDINVLRKE